MCYQRPGNSSWRYTAIGGGGGEDDNGVWLVISLPDLSSVLDAPE